MTLFLAFCAVSADQKVEFPNPVPKNTFMYDVEKKAYTKNTNEFERIDFRDGEWFFIKELNILEFHTRIPGFLDFSDSSRSFYKALYLNNVDRVLVFPQDAAGATRVPYVDEPLALETDYEVVKIYPQGPLTLRDAFSDPDVLNLVFPKEYRAQIVKEWNRLPYLDPQCKGKGTFNSFNNYWGAFFGFDDMLFQAMKSPQTADTEKGAEEVNKGYMITNILRRVVTLVFEPKKELVNYFYTQEDEVETVLNLEDLKEYLEEHLLESPSTNTRYHYFIENFYVILHTLCEDMAVLYLDLNLTKYLKLVFENSEASHLNLSDWFEEWTALRLNFPISPEVLEWNDDLQIFMKQKLANSSQASDDIRQNQYKQLETLRQKAETKFNKMFREFLEYFLGVFQNGFDQPRKQKIQDRFKSKFSKYKPVLDKIISDPEGAKQEHLKALDEFGPSRIFENFLYMEGNNVSMFYLEERVFKDFLPKWEMWKKLEMPMFENTKFEVVGWLKKLLVMVGELPREYLDDPQMFSLMDLEIFKITNKRMNI